MAGQQPQQQRCFRSLALAVWTLCGGGTWAWAPLSTRPSSLASSSLSNGILFTRSETLRLASLSSSSTDPTETTTTEQQQQQQQEPGPTIVTIDCRLVPEGDFVPEPLIDGVVCSQAASGSSSSTELVFGLHQGNYLPGLHALVQDMEVGETVENVSLDAGWGSRNPNLVATLRYDSAGLDPAQIQVGTQLYLAAQQLTCVVTEITDETFTIDGNPPLAGASYLATVTLQAAESGPAVLPYAETIADTSSLSSRYQVATFALGCFWGGELLFMREPGVVATQVGYTHGTVPHPTYQQVCAGTTGHTEAIAVTYDSRAVSYERLVQLAMDRLGEDKYLLNQVGNDIGTQYRHGVYYHTPAQRDAAQAIVHDSFGPDCVTECLPAQTFWTAEDYHQQYLLKGGQSARKGDDTPIRCYG